MQFVAQFEVAALPLERLQQLALQLLKLNRYCGQTEAIHLDEKRFPKKWLGMCPQMPHCQECRITNVNARGKDSSLNGGSDATQTRDLLRDRQVF
jgi:hypothetical protein